MSLKKLCIGLLMATLCATAGAAAAEDHNPGSPTPEAAAPAPAKPHRVVHPREHKPQPKPHKPAPRRVHHKEEAPRS